jgi:hypothetical protein
MRDFNIDLQSRYRSAAIDPHPDVFALDGDLPGDCRQNLLVQNGEQIGLLTRSSFVGQ